MNPATKFAAVCVAAAAIGFTATIAYLLHSLGRAVSYIGRTV